MRLINSRTSGVVADQVKEANTFLSRLTGLMGKKSMAKGTALLLRPCKSVHTFFMKFNIDVIFINSRGEVLHLIPDMPPSRISPYVRGASGVLELSGGTVRDSVALGDILRFVG